MIKKPFVKNTVKHFGDAIVFYCKDCEKIVGTKSVGRKYVYSCNECGTKNVAFGTPRSIKGFFRVDKDDVKPKKIEIPVEEDVQIEE